MSTRQLSDHEVFDFLAGHSDVAQAVSQHEQMFLVDGHPYKWDQTLSHQTLTGIDGVLSLDVDVPIPPPGLAVKGDPTYGNVVVFPDALGILHFVATDNTSLVNEIQKPLYVSDPNYWQMFSDLAQKFQESLPTLPQLGVGIGAVLVIAILLLARR